MILVLELFSSFFALKLFVFHKHSQSKRPDGKGRNAINKSQAGGSCEQRQTFLHLGSPAEQQLEPQDGASSVSATSLAFTSPRQVKTRRVEKGISTTSASSSSISNKGKQPKQRSFISSPTAGASASVSHCSTPCYTASSMSTCSSSPMSTQVVERMPNSTPVLSSHQEHRVISFLEPQDMTVPSSSSSSSNVEVMDSLEPESPQILSFGLSNFMPRSRVNDRALANEGASNNEVTVAEPDLLPVESAVSSRETVSQADNTLHGSISPSQNISEISNVNNILQADMNTNTLSSITDASVAEISTPTASTSSGEYSYHSPSSSSNLNDVSSTTLNPKSVCKDKDCSNASASPDFIPGLWVDWLQDIRRQGLGQQDNQNSNHSQSGVMNNSGPSDGDESMTDTQRETSLEICEPQVGNRHTTDATGILASTAGEILAASATLSASDDSDVEVLMVEPR